MAEAVGAGDLAVEFGFEVVDGGGAGFDFGDDLVLFGYWRERDWCFPQVAEIKMWLFDITGFNHCSKTHRDDSMIHHCVSDDGE